MKQALATAQAPAAIGPYSQGIAAGQTVYVSGQLPIDPATGAIPEGIGGPDRTVPQEHPGHPCRAGHDPGRCGQDYGLSGRHERLCRNDKVYGEYFAQPFPARSAVQVAKLPKGAPLEIECIAVK